jgi:hypothetical protein
VHRLQTAENTGDRLRRGARDVVERLLTGQVDA